MNITEEIAALTTELRELKLLLKSKLSEEERVAIRYQISENTKLLAELFKSSAGENSYIIKSNQTFPTITINSTYIDFLILIYLSQSSVCRSNYSSSR